MIDLPPDGRTASSSPRGTRALAAAFSAVLPGLGQGFAARPYRGVGVAIGFATMSVLALLSFLHIPSLLGVVLPVVLLLGARLWAAIDAARSAARAGGGREVRRLTSTALVLAAALALDAVAGAARQRYLGASFHLPAGSMEPTLLEGEYFMTVPVTGARIARGQVVVFRWPDDSARTFVERIVGGPGDTLAMRDGALFLNGRAVRERYARHTEPGSDPDGEEFDWQRNYLVGGPAVARGYRASRNNWGPLAVPAAMYFVLGDNRDNSLDSRYRGFVPATQVFARPYRVYFSRDLATGRVRWERIGITLRPPSA